jgi:hypothetical protein
MQNDLVVEPNKDLVPGFGVSGQVMCPFSFMAPKMCMKQGCELWVELTYAPGTESEHKVARCSLAWMAILIPELRTTIEKSLQNKEKPKSEGE